MTEKRFKVQSMIQGMEIGETMDLELCEELIKKYGSSSDIDLLITNNGKNMTYQEVVDLLNENEELKKQIKDLYKFVKYDVDNEIDVYPESILEHLVDILKIIGDVEWLKIKELILRKTTLTDRKQQKQ